MYSVVRQPTPPEAFSRTVRWCCPPPWRSAHAASPAIAYPPEISEIHRQNARYRLERLELLVVVPGWPLSRRRPPRGCRLPSSGQRRTDGARRKGTKTTIQLRTTGRLALSARFALLPRLRTGAPETLLDPAASASAWTYRHINTSSPTERAPQLSA